MSNNYNVHSTPTHTSFYSSYSAMTSIALIEMVNNVQPHEADIQTQENSMH